MKHLATAFVVLAVFAGSAWADPAQQARSAIDALEQSVAGLEKAQGARDRIRALTQTVSALEAGLSALRAGLRDAVERSDDLSERLQAQDERTATLLAALMHIGDKRSPALLMHSGGATGGVRAGLVMSDLVPILDAQAADLRRDADQLAELKKIQIEAESQLATGLAAVQSARSSLSEAIAERTDPPKRFINDPVREAILIASADSLGKFVEGLDRIAVDQIAPAPEELEGQKGDLALPVQGHVIRRSGEADAAGVVRPGIIVASEANALVTTPVSASIRYAGPLLDMGQVVILEPQADVLFVFAGLAVLYGSAGDVVAAGTPLGLMGNNERKNAANLSTDGDPTGAGQPERLYIEVRQDDVPEDPGLWFQTDKDG